MKEYNIYKSGDYYEVKYDGVYGNSYKIYDEYMKEVYKYYSMNGFFEESESEILERLQREKASKRNDKIDKILG